MKVVICGTRSFLDGALYDDEKRRDVVDDVLVDAGVRDDVEEVVSGGADGADHAGEVWASANDVPVTVFEADWDEHGRAAGPIRNDEMVDYADFVVAIWDGQSPGTSNTIETAREELGDEHLYVHEYR